MNQDQRIFVKLKLLPFELKRTKLLTDREVMFLVRSLDVSEHNKKPMNKLSPRKWTPTSSKPGFGRYFQQVKQNENNVQSEMQELKRHLGELKREL